MNHQIADLSMSKCSQYKRGGFDVSHVSSQHPGAEDFDDSRSEAMSLANASHLQSSSRFESGIKPHSTLLNQSQMTAGAAELSSVSYEDGFPSAEQNALTHEELARRKREEKERKLREFQRQTKENAQKKLKENAAQKEREEQQKFMQEKERLVKARDYAKKQRQIIDKKAKKGQQQSQQSSVQVLTQEGWVEDPAGEHTHFHEEFVSRKPLESEVIDEVSEHEEDKSSLVVERKQEEEGQLKEMYLRVDQEELEKLGLCNKQDLGQEAIPGLHEYSLLQRFRQQKDLNAPDDYKPRVKAKEDKENQWWQGNQKKGMTEAQRKKAVEKQRYQEALKAIYNDQERLKVGEIIYK